MMFSCDWPTDWLTVCRRAGYDTDSQKTAVAIYCSWNHPTNRRPAPYSSQLEQKSSSRDMVNVGFTHCLSEQTRVTLFSCWAVSIRMFGCWWCLFIDLIVHDNIITGVLLLLWHGTCCVWDNTHAGNDNMDHWTANGWNIRKILKK